MNLGKLLKMKPVEKLSDDDLVLMREVMDERKHAELLHLGLLSMLARTYSLKDGDTIEADGTIKRAG